jgi:tRNA(Ile)-lysidine synthase TilS/MesJ
MVDTMLLSFFYEGRLSTFAPKSYLSRKDIIMIRPMIFLKEANIKSYSKNLPIVKSCCPANGNTKREYVKELVSNISKDIPNVREMMFTALLHSERYNLFNKFNDEIDEIL